MKNDGAAMCKLRKKYEKAFDMKFVIYLVR